MKSSATLIFDIGKTTKKALIFDESFHVLEEKTTSIPETIDDDGFPCEDLVQLVQWIRHTTDHYFEHPQFQITHVNFSAYGASLVLLDRNDGLIIPFYNYLKPYPAATAERFQRQYGNDDNVSRVTASPWLGMLNSGLQAYWLKHNKCDVFEKVNTILHFPQFFPFLLTGKKFCDITSIGCHTMLWDFERSSYHEWSTQEGLAEMFPPVVSPTHHFIAHHAKREVVFGTGVHDSSAALMPYLVSMKEPFLLLSTGTWNICFNPFTSGPLTNEELKKDCLIYMTYEGKNVKASRIFLGNEHEAQQKALARHFGVADDAHKRVEFDGQLYDALSRDNSTDLRFFPLTMEGTGPIPEKSARQTEYAVFSSFEQAQHELIRTLVRWQILSIDLIDPDQTIRNVILVGGFSKSRLFIEILKRELKNRVVFLSDHPRASALGAAWLVHPADHYMGATNLLHITKA